MRKGWVSASDISEDGVLRDDVYLLDVRTTAEFREGHIPGATNMPLGESDQLKDVRAEAVGREVVIVCHTWLRSHVVREQLRGLGVERVNILKGGMSAWQRQGLPVDGRPGGMSLDRQVRIVAGVLVFLGVILGAFVSPWILLLPGAVGARLVYSGITNRGHVATLLAMLPFNR